MELHEMEPILEAVLFAAGEPVEAERLASALNCDLQTVMDGMAQLSGKYEADKRGYRILKLESSYQLASRPDYAQYIKSVLDNRRDYTLSNASLEVLAITAYNQPVTRLYIEQVRGVDSGSVVVNLCERGLLEERGYLDVPGRPKLYGTTPDFLRCFGISSIKELPEFAEGTQLEFPMDDSSLHVLSEEGQSSDAKEASPPALESAIS